MERIDQLLIVGFIFAGELVTQMTTSGIWSIHKGQGSRSEGQAPVVILVSAVAPVLKPRKPKTRAPNRT